MKRMTSLLLTLLLFSSCAALKTPTEAPTEDPYAPIGDENTFLLPELPDIGEYEADKVKRWYDGPMTELIPSDEYGQLYPYLGRVQEFSDTPIRYYGLCTEDGTLVTDPVYTTVSEADGYYILSDAGDGFFENPNTKSSIVKSDGSEVFFKTDKKLTYVAPDVYMTPGRAYLHRDGTPYQAQPKENIIYDNGVMFVISGNRHDVLNSRLEVVQEQVYKDAAGAPGQWIVGKDNRFFVIDAEGNELFSCNGYIYYTDGDYYTKEANAVIRLDGEGNPLESVNLPDVEYITEILAGHARVSQICYDEEKGYNDFKNVYYTLSGEKTDVTDIKYIEDTDTYVIYRPDGMELRCDGRVVTLEPLEAGKSITSAKLYENATFLETRQYKNGKAYAGFTVYTADGRKIAVNDCGRYLYSVSKDDGYDIFTHTGKLLYSVKNKPFASVGSSVTHSRYSGGVLYTYYAPTGEVLVKLHSDTE